MRGPGGRVRRGEVTGSPPVAVVTGGGRRIGAAICRRLSRAGYLVVPTYLGSRREARSLARETGGVALRLDLRRPAAFPRFSRALSRAVPRVDLLVHNAAVFLRTPVGRADAAAWDAVFSVNLRGPFLLTRELLPLLRRSPSPAVLFLGDAGAGDLWPGYLPYCLSKLALEAQARAWRRVLAPGIRVGVVRPGLALRPDGFPKRRWDALRARRGAGRLCAPDAVAAAVARFAAGNR